MKLLLLTLAALALTSVAATDSSSEEDSVKSVGSLEVEDQVDNKVETVTINVNDIPILNPDDIIISPVPVKSDIDDESDSTSTDTEDCTDETETASIPVETETTYTVPVSKLGADNPKVDYTVSPIPVESETVIVSISDLGEAHPDVDLTVSPIPVESDSTSTDTEDCADETIQPLNPDYLAASPIPVPADEIGLTIPNDFLQVETETTYTVPVSELGAYNPKVDYTVSPIPIESESVSTDVVSTVSIKTNTEASADKLEIEKKDSSLKQKNSEKKDKKNKKDKKDKKGKKEKKGKKDKKRKSSEESSSEESSSDENSSEESSSDESSSEEKKSYRNQKKTSWRKH